MNGGRGELERRAAGVLLALSSLPGAHGCGDLGAGAERMLDWLSAAGLRWWQMLPVGPPGPGNSPYSSPSSCAGAELYLSLEGLAREGLLSAREVAAAGATSSARADYAAAASLRAAPLRRAARRFRAAGGPRRRAYRAFCAREGDWLDDYALFTALKHAHGDRPWSAWPEQLRRRQPEELRRARRELAGEVAYHQFVQYQFHLQWQELRRKAGARRVLLMGDLPIFVVHDSADVWAHPELFLLDRRGRPRVVSGVPPDAFCSDGQLWGHPHYRWPAHRRDGFRWWVRRFTRLFDLFDALRVDHFVGFSRAWQVPAGETTARVGRWAPAPGRRLFAEMRRRCGALPIVAEDLGAVTAAVHRLRDEFGFPGMRVLQWAFGAGARYDQPHNHPRRSVAYTGTHDNDTVVGWFQELPAAVRRRALRYCNGTAPTIAWDLVRLAWSSPADLAIAPMQDLLGLGAAARMNRPGTARGNWEWRVPGKALSAARARKLHDLCETYER